MLTLDKTSDQDYIRSLVSLYLDVHVPPSKIVSMLVQNVPKGFRYTILFLESLPRSFWLHYLEQYNNRHYSDKLTVTAISEFEQLLRMLDDIAMNLNAPIRAFSDTAISTWFKVLTLPHLAQLEISQLFREKLIWICLMREVSPSEIVTALMLDKAANKYFTILFLDGTSKTFWVRYFEQYIQKISNNVKLMRSANFDLGRLLETLFAVASQELHSAYEYAAYGTILKLLISPYSTHLSSSHEHMIELTSILLLDRTLPSNVVSMLTHGEADADKFKILFVNKSSKTFWVRYLKSYFEFSSDVEDFASTANTDFQHLLIMLNAVGVQESTTADELMVGSTFLKILVSPEIASIVDQRFLNDFVSACLNQRIPPFEFVLMLVLEEEETNYFQILFENTPSSKLWEVYTTAYDADPPSQQNHMMSTLVQAIGDTKLERILNAASTDEAMSEKAKALLTQLDQWKLKRPFSNDML